MGAANFAPRSPWALKFPPVIGQTPYKLMVGHADYRKAKQGIDNNAALSLAMDCLNSERTNQIRLILGARRPLIVGVHAEEATGRNKIPLAYAEVLADSLRLETEPKIVQASIANHSNAKTIYHRMVSQPTFCGPVKSGGLYLIVDDVCTAGGTLANLKGYIEENGGVVVAMSVLAMRNRDLTYWISLAQSTLAKLKYKHAGLDVLWNREFGYGIDKLTEGEAGHLLSAPSVDVIRNRLADARRDLNIEGDEKANQGTKKEGVSVGDKPF